MKFQDRVYTILTGKLDQSLSYVQSEIEDIGFRGLDLAKSKEELIRLIEDMYDEITADEENALIVLGSSKDNSPQSLTRSLTCHFVQKWLDRLSEAIADLEKNEDKKLNKWAQNKTGKDINIDFKNLIVKKHDEKATMINYLNIIYQVLTYETESLSALIDKIPGDAKGEKALIRDLSTARLSDPRIEQVLNDLWELNDPKIIDEVIGSHQVKNAVNYQAIKFMAEVLKKRIELGIIDSEWKSSDDSEQVEDE